MASSNPTPVGIAVPSLPPKKSATTPAARPKIIGLYGIPGSGKSTLLDKLANHFKAAPQKAGGPEFSFYESSKLLAQLVPGGIPAFQALNYEAKVRARQSAIKRIRD